MKKVLIIGVSGFIGKELYNSLIDKYIVFGISRTKVDLLNCDKVDVLNRKELLDYFSNQDFDIVINLAAILADPNNLEEVNVLIDSLQITRNLVDALKTKKDIHFLNFSSSSVYSNLTGEYTEQGLIKPSDNSDCIYGLSKFNAEMLFEYLLKKHPVELTQLRVPMVYGERMDLRRIHKVFEEELKKCNVISVWGNGERIISQIDVYELVKKIQIVLKQKRIGTYNITGESISMINLALRVIKEKGNSESEIKKIDKGSKAKFILNGSLLNSLLDD